MSFILDALKRAEQQRGAPARAAASLPRAIATDLEPRARWPWVVGGIVGLVVIAAGIVLWHAREPAPVVATSGLPAPTSARPVPAPVATQAPTAVSSPPPVVMSPPTPRAEPVPPVVPERPVSAPPAPRVTEPRHAAPSPVVARTPPPAVAGRSAAPRSVSPPVADDRSAIGRFTPSSPPPRAAAPRPTGEARVAVPRPSAPEPAPPGASSGELKAMAAKLSIQVLGWAPERKDRFVFLNGRKYGEGQMVEDKILVEQITEDSVVLSFQGERLTLKGR